MVKLRRLKPSLQGALIGFITGDITGIDARVKPERMRGSQIGNDGDKRNPSA